MSSCPWGYDVGVMAMCELQSGHSGRHILGVEEKARGENYIDWSEKDDGAFYVHPHTWEVV